MGILGIFLSLGLLMYLAYRGVNVLFLAPLLALLAIAFNTEAPLIASYTQVFMPALADYILKYFPIFLLGSVLGKLMEASGAADSLGQFIAKRIGERRAILAIVLSCALLTYGGVSLFVVAFCIFPVAQGLFARAGLSRALIPGSIALGSFTFTMTALPGTPAIQNAIPMPYFGTTAFAAPLQGLIGAAIMFAFGMFWLNREAKIKTHVSAMPESMTISQQSSLALMPWWRALTPLLVVVLGNYLLSKYVIPSWDTNYLANVTYGQTDLSKLIGLWSLVIALGLAVAVLIVLQWPYLNDLKKTLNEGTMGSLLPIFNTASEVGYGATIASLASFTVIKNAIVNLTPNHPLVSQSIAINLLAGITGSASGGLSITLETMGTSFLEHAKQFNISPELLHRVATMSCGGLDTMPHNGAVITLLAICNLSHKDSYKDIFMVAVVGPLLATTVVVLLSSF